MQFYQCPICGQEASEYETIYGSRSEEYFMPYPLKCMECYLREHTEMDEKQKHTETLAAKRGHDNGCMAREARKAA